MINIDASRTCSLVLSVALLVAACSPSTSTSPDILDGEEIWAQANSCFDREEYLCAMFNYDKLIKDETLGLAVVRRELYLQQAKSAYLISLSPKFDLSAEDKIDALSKGRAMLSSVSYDPSVLSLGMSAKILELSDPCTDMSEALLDQSLSQLSDPNSLIDMQLLDSASPDNIIEALRSQFDVEKKRQTSCTKAQ